MFVGVSTHRRELTTLSEKLSAKTNSSIATGTLGLVFALIFCIQTAFSPGGVYFVFLAGALGSVGIVCSIVGIARGSGRAAGVFGILVFLLGCLMTFSVVMDII